MHAKLGGNPATLPAKGLATPIPERKMDDVMVYEHRETAWRSNRFLIRQKENEKSTSNDKFDKLQLESRYKINKADKAPNNKGRLNASTDC